MIKPPFPWFGGKSLAAELIWRYLGDTPNYVEPFFGSGAVLLNRPHPPKTETVNDLSGFVANFWRATQHDPDSVAVAADNPVNERDLEARHYWLVRQQERLNTILSDPDGYDAKIAGWWAWGQACWIGGGWCDGNGPWHATDSGWVRNPGQGVNRQLPHLGPGKGVNRQLPHLGPGKGVNRQLPHLDPGKERREFLIEYFRGLASRLRHVRVACGDWSRVVTPSITDRFGLTGILLDPPYGEGEMDYSQTSGNQCDGIMSAARTWAIEHGENPLLRIALCCYDGIEMPTGWIRETWKPGSGYASTAKGDTQGKANRGRETIWFSPHCIDVASVEMPLFAGCANEELH